MTYAAGEGLLQGRIDIGPIYPVEIYPMPEEYADDVEEKAARLCQERTVLIYNASTKGKVAELRPSERCEFSIGLPAGHYILDVTGPSGEIMPIDRPRRLNDVDRLVYAQPIEVTVVREQTVAVTIRIRIR